MTLQVAQTDWRRSRKVADQLFRKIVAQRKSCERCGAPGTETAHIIRRRYDAVRCCPDNAWWLCARCHRVVDGDEAAFETLVAKTIGRARRDQLRMVALDTTRLAHAGQFWAEEVEKLSHACTELGIPA